MEPEIKTILKSIMDIEPTEQPDCQSCQENLAAYIDAELEGEAIAVLFPEIKQHLDECPECRREYERLKSVLSMERQGQLIQPPLEPDFDFSYLKNGVISPPQPTESLPKHLSPEDRVRLDIWERVESAGQQTWRLFTQIPILIGQTMGSFGQLPAPLTPKLAPVRADRSGSPTTEGRPQLLQLPSAAHDPAVSLKVGPVLEGKSTLTVQVQTATPRSGRRARVTLKDEAGRMLESEQIGPQGEVTFRQIRPGSYRVEVKYQDKIWELPLTFSLQEE